MTRRNGRWKVVALKRLVFFCRLLLRSTTTGRYNNNNKKQRKRDVGNVAVECCCCCRRNNNGAGSRQNYFPASFGVAQLCPRPLYAPGIRNGNLFSFCFFFFFFFTTLYFYFENKTKQTSGRTLYAGSILDLGSGPCRETFYLYTDQPRKRQYFFFKSANRVNFYSILYFLVNRSGGGIPLDYISSFSFSHH